MAKEVNMNKQASSNNTLSDEMKERIDNYSDQIQTIEKFVDAVRTRPGMYIGPRGSAGFLNMIREVFQNALDQLVSKDTPCDLIKITYDMRNQMVTVFDNGMGIPFNDIIRVYTTAHTSKNFEKKKGDYSAGLNGIGAKATNALSSHFKVNSYNYSGVQKEVLFEKGLVVYEKELPNPECINGTRVEFIPDHTIMGDTHLDSSFLYMLIRDMLSLTQIGNTVDYTSISENGKVYHEVMVNEDGIVTNLIGKCENMIVQPIIFSYDNGDMKLDVAFTFDAKNIDGENITAYANMCPTSTVPANTHVKGFLDGVTGWFVKYMNKTYLGDKAKITIVPNDVKAGLCAMISAFHLNPDFTGQAKEVFSNADFYPFAKQVVTDGLDAWIKDKPQDLQKICKFIKEVAELRLKSDQNKIKISAKYDVAPSSGLPQKYRKPTGPSSLGWELIIVEGDSAESSASVGRDEKRQGIFPIRGKILNVYDNPAKIATNVEIAAIARILNAGVGKDFDITKVKYKKIIFLTDADADGAHIACLLLLIFLRLFPGLVESGMVYKAVPPLYGIKRGKKHEYFTERIDFVKYMQRQYYSSHTITDMDGITISPSKFINLLLENADYTYEMEAVTNRYKIDPNLLEMILIEHVCGRDNLKNLKKVIGGAYRFLRGDDCFEQQGSTIKIKGLVNKSVQTIFYNERFLKDCEAIIPYLERAVLDHKTSFMVDGMPVGLYEMLKSAEAMSSTNINRYKGLGEMNGQQLGESALRPDSNRMLIRYTVNDIHEDIRIIRTYESDKRIILSHIGSVNRVDLIG